MDLFTEDTVYEVFRRTLRGRAEVAAMLSKAPHGVHLGGPQRIEIEGDSANTIQNYLFIDGGTGKWNAGWYYRTLVRTARGRKISQQTVVKMQEDRGRPRLPNPTPGRSAGRRVSVRTQRGALGVTK